MNGQELTDKLKELNSASCISCTERELTDFINYGLLIKSGNTYKTRNNKNIDVKIIKDLTLSLDLDIQGVISRCNDINDRCKKYYCMTQKTYNVYKEHNYIVKKSDVEYYKFYDNELWRVVII